MPLYLYVDVVYILFFIFIVIYNFNDKINLKNFYIFTTFLIFLVVIINLLYPNTSNKIYYNASELPSQTGRLLNNIRCADKDDKEGFLTYGPYIKLKHGKKYKFNLIYSSNQNNNNIVGFWDVYCGRGNVINNGELKGTNGGKTSIDGSFMLKENCLAEIRSFFKGSGDLCVWSLEILE
jgi:energy-coupling factor transporter transmembrane protein EcfT